MIGTMAKLAGKTKEMEMGAVSAALALPRDTHHKILPPEGVDFSRMVEYIEKRLPMLASRVLERFPKPKDLLSDATHDS